MLLELGWNDETMSVDLRDGVVTVGGGPKDGVRLHGLPHGLLTLVVDAPRLTVTSLRSLRIGAGLFPARVPRLLLEGEALKLPNDVVLHRVVDAQRRGSRERMDTAFVAKELLGGAGLEVALTRAATLTCVAGNDQGVVYPLDRAECVLGRANEADVRVRDRATSRRHALLTRRGHRAVVRELSATNGVFLNGVRVRTEAEVRPGDVLELGHTMLRYEEGARAPGEATVVEPQPPPAPPAALDQGAPPEADELTFRLPQRRRVPTEAMLMAVGATLALVGAGVAVMLLR
jgi:hypothetical protein